MKNIAKKLFCLTAALLLIVALPLSAKAASPKPLPCEDYGRVLTTVEEDALNASLREVSRKLGINIAIRTDTSLDGYSIERAARELAHTNYSELDDPSGIVLLYVAMEEREWYIYTEGDAYDYLTDEALDDIEDTVVPLMSAGNYYKAFTTYVELCDKYLTMGLEGNVYRGSFPIGESLLIALVVGVVVGLIVVSSMKAKLKTVRPRREAHEYTRPGSMQLTASRDLYLYRTVHRRPKPKNTSSGGSGGSRSGGRGGKF